MAHCGSPEHTSHRHCSTTTDVSESAAEEGHHQHRPKGPARTLSITRQPSNEDNDDDNGEIRPALYCFLPPEYGNALVQESDGSFFESFTALSWKQENRRLRTATENEKESEKPPPSESQFVNKSKIHQLQRKEFELLYIEVLYTIKHKIGTTSGSHLPFIQDLYLYAQEAFGVSPEDHARLLAKASEEKAPLVVLNATVIEARDLEAKDANGFSDPYCMLGIMPGNRRDMDRTHSESGFSSDEEPLHKLKEKRSSALKKFSQSIKRKKEKHTAVRDILPARYIRSTSVVTETLNPNWNEKFRFDLDDHMTDRLHLDIWDHDDETSVFDAASKLNEIQGFKGLGRVFKQIAQSARTSSSGNVDDFLGCVNLRLDDIPSTGIDKWYDLEGRSSLSSVEGQIRLRLALGTREDRGIPEEDNWTDFRQHQDLMGIFLEHELRQFSEPSYKWTGGLPQAPLTILHQHAIQGDITEIQQAVCRWMAYSRKHMEHPFDYEVLLRLLEELDVVWAPGGLSRDESESLADSFNMFIEYCLGLLAKIRDVFPAANMTAQIRLQNMLKCVSLLHRMEVFYKCCPFAKDICHEITTVLKRGNHEWYKRIAAVSKPNTKNEDDVLQCLTELVNMLNTDIQKGLQYHDKIIDSVISVKYFTLTYRQLENMLTTDVKKAVADELGLDMNKELDKVHVSTAAIEDSELDCPHLQQSQSQLFELYLALQEFMKFRERLPSNDRKGLTISHYYDWFKPVITRWLPMARHKLMKRIRKAVDLDKDVQEMAEVESGVKHSTSAVDVCCCFGQIIEFWRQLDWPDLSGSYAYVTRLTDDMCQGAIFYADLIHEKLRAAGYYDEIGQFDVTEQLCITINNIEQVRRALKPLPDALKFTQIQHSIDRTHGEKMGRQAKQALTGLMKNADESMVKKIKQVVDRVADKMRPDLKKDVFHLCWSPESVPAEEAISELMTYLDSNLLTLNSNLLRTNFDRILDSIWVEALEEFKDVIISECDETKNPSFYERLFEALNILVEFFHANGKGLSLETIQSDQYREVQNMLRLYKSDTEELIEIYYQEKLEEQKRAQGTKFGTLTVRVYYNYDAEILCVEVLSARDIIPLDTNGLSDPFVLIELCPPHYFPNQTEQKTKIIKKTLHPLFDESFEFNVTADECKRPGAVIMFTVMDHDIMFTNDFAGEVFMSLVDIPGVNGEEVSGFTALKSVTIPLIQSKGKDHGALSVLLKRTWDKDAQEFARKRLVVEEQAMTE